VGREPELKQLQSAFDAAISGQGALMMVTGEPGIGKTALCEQLATYVTLRGGRTLVGHCYEKGSLSLPYLAFVEALRSYVLSREVKDAAGRSWAAAPRITGPHRLRDKGTAQDKLRALEPT
jgi:adenylate cyclase